MKKIILIFLFLSLAQTTYSANYPADWWKAVPRQGAPAWEILPQDAKPGEVILSKRTELGIFSNFAATPFILDSKKYASVEGLWQMMKYPDPSDPTDPRLQKDLVWKYTRDQVAQLTGFEAKAAGDDTKDNYTKLSITWVSYQGKRMEYKGADQMAHFEIISRAIKAKIDQNQKAKDLLIATGDLILRPDHIQESNVPPAYAYYDILTKIRKVVSQKFSLGKAPDEAATEAYLIVR